MRSNNRLWIIAPLTAFTIVCAPAVASANEQPVAEVTAVTEVSPQVEPTPEVVETAPAPEVVAPSPEPAPVVTPSPEPAPAPVVEVAPAPVVQNPEPVVDQPVAEPITESTPQSVAKSTPEVAAAQVQQVAPVPEAAPVVTTKAPTVKVKNNSVGVRNPDATSTFLGTYHVLNLQGLGYNGKVSHAVLNSTTLKRTPNQYTDFNDLRAGKNGGIDGLNTLTVYNTEGGYTTYTFILDGSGPTIHSINGYKGTVVGTAPGFIGTFPKLDVKAYDKLSQVASFTLNGVVKKVTPNQYSDFNGIVPGVGGAVEGLNTLVLTDIYGNTTTYTFILDTTKPVINMPAPGEWVSGVHTWTITQDEANPATAYVEIQQKDANGKWRKSQGFEIKNSNDLTVTFDTTKLVDGAETQIKISSTDKANNHTSDTFKVEIDNTAPVFELKDTSVGSDGVFSLGSWKLIDKASVANPSAKVSGIAGVVVNGKFYQRSVNKYSDLNNLKVGYYNVKEGSNEIGVVDLAGNTTYQTVIFDSIAPTVVDVKQVWDAEKGRTMVTVTYSEDIPESEVQQGWYGSGTTYTKAFYNTKVYLLTFKDQAGNTGCYTIVPEGAPVVEEPAPTDPENPSEPEQPSEPSNPEEPSLPETPGDTENPVEQPTTGNSPEDYTQGDDIVTPVSNQLPSTTQSSSQPAAAPAPQTVSASHDTLATTGAGLGLLGLAGLLTGSGLGMKRFSFIKRSR